MHIKGLKQGFGCIEKGRGIVVSPNNDSAVARGPGESREKVVIERLGQIAGSSGVKYIAAEQKNVYLLFLNGMQKPIEEQRELFIALLSVEHPSQVPVGCVEYFHWSSLSKSIPDFTHVDCCFVHFLQEGT